MGALGLWLLFSLSKPVTYSSQIRIELMKVPLQFSAPISNQHTYTIQVKSNGWSYLVAKLKNNTPTIKLEVNEQPVGGTLVLSTRLGDISKQLGKDRTVTAIQPKSINLKRSKIVSKVVPVLLRHQLTYERFYGQSGPVQLQPNHVTLSGKAEDIESIQAVYTEILQMKQLNTDVKQWMNIETPQQGTSILSPQRVLVTFPISRFTEKQVTLPIMVHNNTKGRTLVVLPNQVTLTFSVALNQYENIRAANFEAYIDVEGKDSKELNTLPIKFKKAPNFVRIIRTEPHTVDLITYK